MGYTDETVGDRDRGQGQVSGHWLRRAHGWRARVRSRPRVHRVYKITVGLIGAAIALAGLVLVPLPGPGWLIVFIGLAVLASEFVWARRLQQFAKARLLAWTHWLGRQSWLVRGAVVALTSAFVVGVVYVLATWTGGVDWFVEQVKIL